MTWVQFGIFLAVTLAAVEGGMRLRWKSIEAMFDRALMHGGSLDTLSKALRENSEVSRTQSEKAMQAADQAVEAVGLLHKRVRALEEHPFLRPLGGNGHKEG